MSEPVTALTAHDLTPGHIYRVEFDDCCVQGHFIGVFIEIRVIDDQGAPFEDAIVFDSGELQPVDWGQWTITEILPTDHDDDNDNEVNDEYEAFSWRCCEHTNRQHHSGGCWACTCTMPPA